MEPLPQLELPSLCVHEMAPLLNGSINSQALKYALGGIAASNAANDDQESQRDKSVISFCNLEKFVPIRYHSCMFHPPVGLLRIFEEAGLTPSQARTAATALYEARKSDPEALRSLWYEASSALDMTNLTVGQKSVVGSEVSDSINNPPVPTVAPRLYKDERVRGVNSSESFLLEVYGRWLGEGGGLYLHMVRHLDPELIVGLDNAFRGRRNELISLLPTKARSNDAELARLGLALPGDRKAAARLASAALRRVRT